MLQLALAIALKKKAYEKNHGVVSVGDYISILRNKLEKHNDKQNITPIINHIDTQLESQNLDDTVISLNSSSIDQLLCETQLNRVESFNENLPDSPALEAHSFLNTQELMKDLPLMDREKSTPTDQGNRLDVPSTELIKTVRQPEKSIYTIQTIESNNLIQTAEDNQNSNSIDHIQSITSEEISKIHSIKPVRSFDEDYSEVRKAILRLTRQKHLTFSPTHKKLIQIFNILHKHSSNSSKLNQSNMLSSAFLKLMIRLFDIPMLTDSHIHNLFKTLINCYLINFNNFTPNAKSQFGIIFQFLFDMLAINAKQVFDYGQSYLKKICNHKPKTQLTMLKDENQLQIFLYYLLQLLFLLLNSNKFIVEYVHFIEDKLRLLLAFLIRNDNEELLRMFHQNRLKFRHKHKLK